MKDNIKDAKKMKDEAAAAATENTADSGSVHKREKPFTRLRDFVIRITGAKKRPIKLSRHLRLRRPRLIWGVIITAILLTLILTHTGTFLNNSDLEQGTGILLFALSVIMALVIGLASTIGVLAPKKLTRAVSLVLYFGAPFVAALMSECLQGIFIYKWSPGTFFLNYLLFLVLYSIPAVFTGSFRRSIIIMTPIIFAFSFIASLILTFRGTPLLPADIATIGTGLGVASSYKYKVTYYFILGLEIFLLFEILAWRQPQLKVRRKFRWAFRLASLGLVIAICLPFYTTSIAANNGIKPDFWNQARGYKRTGTVYNFILNTRYLIVEKPAGYDASEIPDILNKLIDNDEGDNGILASARQMQADQEKASSASSAAEGSGSEDSQSAGQDQTAQAGQASDASGQDGQNTQAADDDTSIAYSTKTVENASDALTISKAADTADSDESSGTSGGNSLVGDFLNDSADKDEAASQNLPNSGTDTKLAVQYTSNTNQPAQSATLKKGEMPDIICIMNETFSDLRILGDLSTNKDYMPFLRNLTKNTIKGNLYMPVNGAGTSNSEFEFLTGNSMAFLPSGSNAYELYIKSKLPSLAQTLASQGYSRTAYHTYYGRSWNRNTNYPLLGFEHFYALEDILDRQTVEQYRDGDTSLYEFQSKINQMYPDQNVLLRRFVSDSFDYKKLEEMYENRDSSRPFFMFNVTMQNHGSYDLSYSNFNQQIQLTSTDKYYPRANRYLSLIYESDKALSELVDYFSKVDRPVMIVMFGDHQPSIEDSFVESLLGSNLSDLTVTQTQKRYVTPFVIWTNYKSDSEYIEKMSTNYLSTLVLQQAGLQGTAYNHYLSAMYRRLPVIDTTGYITSDNKYYTYDDDTKYTETLDGYKKLVYNFMFDQINRDTDQFYLENQDSTQEN